MTGCGSPWRARLSEYLDGDLSAADRAGVEAHLDACPDCLRTLGELEAVVARARSLEDRPPGRDLWPGVEAAITAPGSAAGAGARAGGSDPRARLSGGRFGRGWARRSVRMTLPQLAAAALVVMLVSGGSAWLLGPGLDLGEPAGTTATGGPVRAVALEAEAPEAVASEVADLERTLLEARDRLDPATVRILEKNLAVIDRAIRESRRALELDPGNPFLERHLDRAWERKVEYLRDAASVLEWSS